MIKLFEEYKYTFLKSDKINLIKKIKEFLNHIILSDHKFTDSTKDEVGIVQKNDNNRYYHLIYFGGLSDHDLSLYFHFNQPYSGLISYMVNVLEEKFDTHKEGGDGVYFKCEYNGTDKFDIDDIKFSKKEYEIFKESERFGL